MEGKEKENKRGLAWGHTPVSFHLQGAETGAGAGGREDVLGVGSERFRRLPEIGCVLHPDEFHLSDGLAV